MLQKIHSQRTSIISLKIIQANQECIKLQKAMVLCLINQQAELIEQLDFRNILIQNYIENCLKMGAQVRQPLPPTIQQINSHEESQLPKIQIHWYSSPANQVLRAAQQVSLPQQLNQKDAKFIKQLLARNKPSSSSHRANSNQLLKKKAVPQSHQKGHKEKTRKIERRRLQTSTAYGQSNKQNETKIIQSKSGANKKYCCQIEDWEEASG